MEEIAMANMAAKMFTSLLEENQLTYRFLDEEESTLRVGWKLKATNISLFFKFAEDGSNVHFEGHEFLMVPEGNIEQMYKICNQMNRDFRWVKFSVNEELKEVVVEGDAVIQLDSCAQECLELMIRTTRIIDEAYPRFMKEMWA